MISQSVTLSASALALALSDVLPMAGPPGSGWLGAVHLEAGGGSLVAVATNRFVLGCSRVDCHGDDAMAVTLAVRHGRAVARAARKAADDPAATASITADGVVTFDSTAAPSTVAGKTIPQWTDWRRSLMPANLVVRGDICVDAGLLAKFAKVRAGLSCGERTMMLTPIEFGGGHTSMVVVRIGADFVGAVAQLTIRRMDGNAAPKEGLYPEWLQ